ncbi:MAG: matrixin family metalloprotease [Candidatus Aenigmarchaeota archaeon]|nr:matrixin family metalloprotease [Candidatus Aenigmarchaeota archaeon]
MKLFRNLSALALILAVLASACVSQGTQGTYGYEKAVQNKNLETSKGFDYENYKPPATEIKHPLLVKFPIVKSPMPYYVYNDTEINEYKYELTMRNVRTAFDRWENATKGRVMFVQASQKPEDGITIKLVTNLTSDTIGEARPFGYQYDDYSLITGGEMKLEPTFGGAENLVQIMHEIGHVMGFAHNDNSHSVMFPFNAYSQEITPEITDALDILYRDVPAS